MQSSLLHILIPSHFHILILGYFHMLEAALRKTQGPDSRLSSQVFLPVSVLLPSFPIPRPYKERES
jgi:hypothetical protein